MAVSPGDPPPSYRPYVPEDSQEPEFSVRALLIGIVLAAILGAANAYVGMTAGLTVAATFPAAVIAMGILRPQGGSILEENLARTTASVGEALVAGAIFTIPAFVIVGTWDDLLTPQNYLEGSMMLLVGGILGVLFVIVLRRALVSESDLPFPESVAAAEIHKAGRKGASGAGLVFGALGVSMVLEFFKNNAGVKVIRDTMTGFWDLGVSKVGIGAGMQSYAGGIPWSTPAASPALMGVGYVIGPRLAAINFSGGVLAWGFLVPLVLFVNGQSGELATVAATEGWSVAADEAWVNIVRPVAVGAMMVGAMSTLYGMRTSLVSGIGKAMADLRTRRAGQNTTSRYERDLPMSVVFGLIGLMVIPTFGLYWYFTQSLLAGFVAALIMIAAGFLFCAVAGYLVGVIGSSSNPISGLTLSTLILAAALMVILGQSGPGGVAAVLGVAAVVCCACGIGGDMMQDLKVGHILGATPARMELAEIISVVVVSFMLIAPIGWLHAADIQLGGQGIGGDNLPAPQAGLMAMLSQGIIAGDMAWPLVVAGMGFSAALILIGAPSPMLIAVGMYLPLESTFAIFVGGLFRWWVERACAKRGLQQDATDRRVSKGILVASGLIAGEALTGVLLAGYVIVTSQTEGIARLVADDSPVAIIAMFGVFAIVGGLLIRIPLRHDESATSG